MSVLDREALEGSPLADLHALASELSLDGFRRLRKAALIDALLAHQGGEQAGAETSRGGDAEDDDAGSSSGSRRRRGRRGGRGRGHAGRDGEAEADAEEEAGPAPRSRRGRGPAAGSDDAEPALRSRRGSRSAAEADAEPEPTMVEGTVELLANGSGFVRVSPPEASEDDVYISAAQVKRCELVSGDVITGPRRAPHRSERYPSLVRIDTINGGPAADVADRARYDDLPAAFPDKAFDLSGNATLKAIAAVAPIGRGSRVTITGGSLSGKSHTLRLLVDTLSQVEGLTLFVALAGVRPEELSEWRSAPVQPTAAVTFAASGDTQDHAVELVVDQARRIAARGSDAVVLIDSLDGLHPLSARKALASARNIVDGGSLTVIATSRSAIGGETTVITLDRTLALTGTFPALDVLNSATVRPLLLVGTRAGNAAVKARQKVQTK